MALGRLVGRDRRIGIAGPVLEELRFRRGGLVAKQAHKLSPTMGIQGGFWRLATYVCRYPQDAEVTLTAASMLTPTPG